MGYPGEHRQPGGRPPGPPPRPPRDPSRDQWYGGAPSDDPSFGGQGGSGPPPGAPYGPPGSGGPPDDPYGGGPYAPGGAPGDPYPPAGAPNEPYFPGEPHVSAKPGDPYAPPDPYGADLPGPGGPGSPSGPYDSDAPYGPPPGGRRGGGRRAPRKFGTPLVIGAAVVAGVVLIGGGVATAVALSGGDETPAPTKPPVAASSPGAPSSTPSSEPSTASGEKTKSRTTDPKPLTLDEIFAHKKFKEKGVKYEMEARDADTKCSKGAHGDDLEKALAKADCTQLLRATFATGGGKYVGTIGVANVQDEHAAKKVKKAAEGKDSYVQPLQGEEEAKKIGHDSAVGAVDVRGHYVIMSWVQYPSGKKIPKKSYDTIAKFVRGVTMGSNLGPALGYRAITGKPFAT